MILTKNEVCNLERCINSLQWCQEIIVVDSGSTDGTIQLAEALGIKVFTHIQPPPFKISEQRNWALENCQLKSEWVLFLDADEIIPPDLAAEIQRICSANNQEYNAYELPARYLFWGKWLKLTQGYPNWHSRLLKLGEVTFTGGVWEHFSAGTKVSRINIPYDHYANSKGFGDWLERHNRYSSWDAQKVVDFLETGKTSALGTERKLKLRLLAAKLWFMRPIVRFIQMYFLRLGFLEGITALIFCLLYAMYEFMTVVKIIELRRKKSGLPL
ncbi:glycosyltransferase family 2 protein [Nostoc sp. PCC 7120 = FACHB-418]|uniref:Glycosyltransferase family 2 protein n=1 Tax=Anabaena cylindrica FACHB-318 TaxID=2692880 RepID=A0ABR7ZGC2_ANACY|nr:glycosyltransferase family 2 protein [Anabaena cylindrica FACHB-318]MBD2264221.1 glycosyltransferase family 2 protein [Anabaena sp. FACHB-709]MBD2273564.1 glycosyltransferase family 2 protein [Nostoc sp. PCC 7120 = FACHB-418]MBD2281695.1 glycosyltransferase family 2 protein [Anabaena cylindrica FACHB-170]MBD2347593.1 glycosyltransferase family 2 protein [Trichormus variabilis FACHB-171]HBW30538.1 glycosyltransferase family 2 protein [Nostoc sp. UBA8866]